MPTDRRTAKIDRQAAAWAAKTGRGDELPAAQQAELDAWLVADIRHFGAYARAAATLAQLDRMRGAGPSALRTPASQTSRRSVLLTGAAASVGALAWGSEIACRRLHQSVYITRRGQTAVMPLSDGSVVTLNTDSEARSRYSPASREVELVRGEALFEVAKNAERPFIVKVADLQVRAVGTSFAVTSLSSQPVKILVSEGLVEVKRTSSVGDRLLHVGAGARAMAPSDGPISMTLVAPSEMTRDLAWREGRIVFDDETLADAAKEFSRYSATPIVIDDPDVAARTVTGLFVSNDPVGFCRAVAISLGLHAEVGDNEVRLTP